MVQVVIGNLLVKFLDNVPYFADVLPGCFVVSIPTRRKSPLKGCFPGEFRAAMATWSLEPGGNPTGGILVVQSDPVELDFTVLEIG